MCASTALFVSLDYDEYCPYMGTENELQSTHASEHPGFKRSDKELAADIRLALERAFKAGRESK